MSGNKEEEVVLSSLGFSSKDSTLFLREDRCCVKCEHNFDFDFIFSYTIAKLKGK